jgi:hypothetical protein
LDRLHIRVHLWWVSRWIRRLLVVTGARCPLTKPVVTAVELQATTEPHCSRGVQTGVYTAVFTLTWYIASRLPEVRGRACAGAASASYASYRSDYIYYPARRCKHLLIPWQMPPKRRSRQQPQDFKPGNRGLTSSTNSYWDPTPKFASSGLSSSPSISIHRSSGVPKRRRKRDKLPWNDRSQMDLRPSCSYYNSAAPTRMTAYQVGEDGKVYMDNKNNRLEQDSIFSNSIGHNRRNLNPNHFDRVMQERTVGLPMSHVTVQSHPDCSRRPGLTMQVDSESRPPRAEYQELSSTQLVSMQKMPRRYYQVKEDDYLHYSPPVAKAKRTPAPFKNFSAAEQWSAHDSRRSRDYSLNSQERLGAMSNLANMHQGREQPSRNPRQRAL